MNQQKYEHALLRRTEVNIGGEWFVEEVWNAGHPYCPYQVCQRGRWWWQRKPQSALMITRRIPMPAVHPLSSATNIAVFPGGGGDAA